MLINTRPIIYNNRRTFIIKEKNTKLFHLAFTAIFFATCSTAGATNIELSLLDSSYTGPNTCYTIKNKDKNSGSEEKIFENFDDIFFFAKRHTLEPNGLTRSLSFTQGNTSEELNFKVEFLCELGSKPLLTSYVPFETPEVALKNKDLIKLMPFFSLDASLTEKERETLRSITKITKIRFELAKGSSGKKSKAWLLFELEVSSEKDNLSSPQKTRVAMGLSQS